jgi:predicted transposase/invertase (TIGR01784 family)
VRKIKEGKKHTNNIDNKTDIYYYIYDTNETVKLNVPNYIYPVSEEEDSEPWGMVREESEEYTIIGSISYEHDKTYKTILENTKDVAHIINEALELKGKEQISPEELEKYKSGFVTKELTSREADIVYKLKERNIYFLIEHQSKPDYSMPYRIKEYKMEIIKSAIDIDKAKTKEYELPEVIPIVIYTGKNKWKVRLYLEEIQDDRLKKVNLEKYNLIDINNYKKEDLLASNNFIDKFFLLEKITDYAEYTETLEKIIEQTTDARDKAKLKEILVTTIEEKLGEEKAKEIIRKIEIGDDKDMWQAIEMIREENKTIRKEGIRQGKIDGIKEGRNKERVQIICNMLNSGMQVEEIKRLTKVSKKEIEAIKKTL